MQRHRYRGKFPMDAPAIANVRTVQCHRFYANISMNTSAIVNVATMQRCGCYTNIPMNVFATMNTLTTQLGTSCSFDSPGLARNEPTPGKRSQGDSTP